MRTVGEGKPPMGMRSGASGPPSAGEQRTPGVGAPGARQPAYGQGIVVSVIVAVLLLVLAIMAAGDADAGALPLAETTGPLYWLLAVITLLVAGFGALRAERGAAHAAAAVGHPRPTTAMHTAWAVPVVATLAAILLVATYPNNRAMLVAGPALAFFGTAGALFSRDLLDDTSDGTQRAATVIHTLVIHAVAFLAFGAVYLNKLSGWLTVPLVGIIGGLLTIEALERADIGRPRRLLYALLGAATLAEATIALAWWPTYGWTGAAVLLVAFYLAAGLLLAHAQRAALRLRDLVEFGLVGVIAFAILAITA